MSTVWIIGGSGFVGSALSQTLISQGHAVVSIDMRASRIADVVSVIADASSVELRNNEELLGVQRPDVVVNLAGAPIFQRWTSAAKSLILESRIASTRVIVDMILDGFISPKQFVCASATGAYGERGEDEISVSDQFPPEGESFLADVCRAWEAEALRAAAMIPVTIVRQGIVLGAGGMLATLAPFFKIGLGGSIGNGKQWMPWIHVDDLIRMYVDIVMHVSNLPQPGHTIVLACSPRPVRNKEFSIEYARSLGRPCLFVIPKFALALRYGGLAREISCSQKVIGGSGVSPEFSFVYPTISEALAHLASQKK